MTQFLNGFLFEGSQQIIFFKKSSRQIMDEHIEASMHIVLGAFQLSRVCGVAQSRQLLLRCKTTQLEKKTQILRKDVFYSPNAPLRSC